jgi:hypothetical protein
MFSPPTPAHVVNPPVRVSFAFFVLFFNTTGCFVSFFVG